MDWIDKLVADLNDGVTAKRPCSFLTDIEGRLLILLADAVATRTAMMDAFDAVDVLVAQSKDEPSGDLIESWATLNRMAHSSELAMRKALAPLLEPSRRRSD